MADPVSAAIIISAVVGVGSAAVSYKNSKATAKIQQWEADEQARAATLQYKQQKAERLSSLRQALANNTVTAAVSGVSVNSGNVQDVQNQSIANNEADELNSRAQYLGAQSSLAYQKSAAASLGKLSGYGSILSGIGSVAQGYAGYQNAQVTGD